MTEYNNTIAGERAENNFEEEYIAVRKKENRIYSNEEVSSLPDINPHHIHYNEWLVRKHSCKKLVNYLQKKNKPLKILEVGCGNGWLSAKLAEIKNTEVTGLDINHTEIKQAGEVFNKKNLQFLYAGIESGRLPKKNFDIILFAASIQYFDDPELVLGRVFSYLTPGGEVHILDTNFYQPGQVQRAGARTQNYYASLGFPGMATRYFHHSWSQLERFNYTVLYNPHSFFNRLSGRKNIFPWIKITR